jgi:hypothetical protein
MDKLPIPQDYQIHAQNESGINGIGSIDILRDKNYYYSCYYRDSFTNTVTRTTY